MSAAVASNDQKIVEAVNGQWSAWVNTGTCSKTCGGGKKKQERSCSNPAPRDGGRGCIGDSSRSIDCNSQPCPVDGQWSAWTNYKTCSKPCGGGKQQQKRVCNNPAPQNGGRDCEEGHIRLIYCNQQACKVDGKWSSWINDGACSKKCEVGKQKQRRTCTDPQPQNGGKVCSGPSSRVLNCNTQPCKEFVRELMQGYLHPTLKTAEHTRKQTTRDNESHLKTIVGSPRHLLRYTTIQIIQIMDMCSALSFLLDNIYVRFGENLYKQVVGIPMGSNCAPLVADLFSYTYEMEFNQNLQRQEKHNDVKCFIGISRYLDDILTIDNPVFE
ncbi:hypothetical protein FSP39_008071 [Pinctada imbricata]|uniref:Hemicentin-1 n=1 Tax=Pinctada imbricata TaxID=66713 RepID=A0AA88XVX1_PINIB|nr:hypothetical protein FSP39_008071 [Pinctada imbricata]